jgi:resuscitation-promoting factor RpfB
MWAMKRTFSALSIMFAACVLLGCQPEPEPQMIVSVIVDGRSLTYDVPEPITVSEFLSEIGVTTGELDRVVPPPFTQISDGLQITVRRVTEESYCEDRDLPYNRRSVINETLAPGTEVLFQAGQNGKERQCFRVQIVDGIRGEPASVGSATVLTAPVDEIIYSGPTTTLEPVEVRGTLAYVSGGNAWVMRGSSDTRHPITTSGNVDPTRAFSLSSDGRQLLFARTTSTGGEFANQLSVILDVNAAQPQTVDLSRTNVLWADWVPASPNIISFTRAEPRQTSPGWGAFNDLWLVTIDPLTGDEVSITPVIDESPGRGGPFSWWGRQYAWSANGQQLAWIHADGVGTVNLETGELNPPIVRYTEFSPRSDWSWRTSVSWAPSGDTLVGVVHGPPIGSESPDRSPVFNIDVFAADGSFQGTLVEQAGIWSSPKYDPTGRRIAYFRARQPLVSVPDSSEYDLYVADVDGSNARRVFPEPDQRGITQRDFAWNAEGSEIAFIFQGNVWIVDVISGVASQVTLDGTASRPVWK